MHNYWLDLSLTLLLIRPTYHLIFSCTGCCCWPTCVRRNRKSMSPNLEIPLLKFSTNQKPSLGIYCKQMSESKRERTGLWKTETDWKGIKSENRTVWELGNASWTRITFHRRKGRPGKVCWFLDMIGQLSLFGIAGLPVCACVCVVLPTHWIPKYSFFWQREAIFGMWGQPQRSACGLRLGFKVEVRKSLG